MEKQLKTIEKVQLQDLRLDSDENMHLINCVSCGAPVPAKNINIHEQICKCDHCNAVFSFEEQLKKSASKSHKQEVLRPTGIDLFYFQDELEISVHQPIGLFEGMGWMSTFAFITVFFLTGIVWLIDREIHVLWPIITGFLSILGTALLLIGRKNHRTYISTNQGQLNVEWRPKKLVRDKSYQIRDIDQLYIKGVTGAMSVYMILNTIEGQKHVRLISGLKTISKARFLEQQLEKHLKIKDRNVPEELKI